LLLYIVLVYCYSLYYFIVLGSSHLYVFVHPKKHDNFPDLPDVITWEFAQMEIAQARGFTAQDTSGLTKGNIPQARENNALHSAHA